MDAKKQEVAEVQAIKGINSTARIRDLFGDSHRLNCQVIDCFPHQPLLYSPQYIEW